MNYNGNLANVFNKLPDNFTFGLELEFSGGLTVDETQNILDLLIEKGYIREGWSVHYDNSIVDDDGKGAEIVSPPICDDEQSKKEIEIITKVIKEFGGEMNEKTGGHIHFGLQCLGPDIKTIKNFLKIYTVFEPLLYKLSTGDLDYVRAGCKDYAKPIQRRLVNVIDKESDSLLKVFCNLLVNVGANPTHYGENRYYGLNIQRIIEAFRNIPEDMDEEVFLQKLFSGEEIIGNDGKPVNATIELRFRNGSSDPDEILSAVRMFGGMFVAAKDMDDDNKSILQSMYRNAKKRRRFVFDKVLRRDREDLRFVDCDNDEEIMRKKFHDSPYGDGKIDYNTYKYFMLLVNPELPESIIIGLYKEAQAKLRPTDYKNTSNVSENGISGVLRLVA